MSFSISFVMIILKFWKKIGTVASYWKDSGGRILNNLRETLTYGKLLKHEFCPFLRNYGWVCNMLYYIDSLWSYWNNFFMQKLLELGKNLVSKGLPYIICESGPQTSWDNSSTRPCILALVTLPINILDILISSCVPDLGVMAEIVQILTSKFCSANKSPG